jgi:hypothetical protein
MWTEDASMAVDNAQGEKRKGIMQIIEPPRMLAARRVVWTVAMNWRVGGGFGSGRSSGEREMRNAARAVGDNG